MSARVLLFASICGCGIPNAQDAEIASTIGRVIEQGYGKFADKEVAEESGGQVWYWKPGVGGNPTIDLYEVTTPADIAGIERLAREALSATEGANSVTLRFYEKQKWQVAPNGSKSREPEKLLKKVTYDKGD